MLVLSRKANQSIMIGSDIRILVVDLDRDQVKLGIEAPRDVAIHRSEVFEEIHGTNRSATQDELWAVGKEPAETDTSRHADGD